jgi:hypothetical protein
MIKLGQKVRDTVTGHEGVATSKVEYLNGSVRFCVEGKAIDGKATGDGTYFDHERLEAAE